MATVKKQGTGYKITVSMGYDVHGKQIRQHMTWTPSPGMTPKQVEKELKRQEVLFEESCKARQITGGSLKLADFAQLWFRDYAEKQLKPRTVANYRFLLRRVNDGLGHIRLDRLQPRQLLSFYSNLAEDDVRLDTKYALHTDLKQLLKERNLTQAKFSTMAGLSLNTIESAIGGSNVSAASAEKISLTLDMPRADLFTPVKKDGLSGKTLLHYHRFLSAMLETAVQWQYIPSNPCSRVKPPRAAQTETAYLDEAQAGQLIAALDGEPPQYRTAVLLLLNTGLRRGELCGLEWADVDLEHGVLSVRRNSLYLPGKGVYTDTPKTKSSARTIRMPPSCIPLLEQHRAWQAQYRADLGDQWRESGRLFTSADGSPIHPDTLTSWFSDFIKRHDLPKVTLHGLRHTNASLLIAAGTNIRTVSGRLGHSQASTTANIYAHAIQSADAIAAEALGNILSPATPVNTK